jgi:hypothetical protein
MNQPHEVYVNYIKQLQEKEIYSLKKVLVLQRRIYVAEATLAESDHKRLKLTERIQQLEQQVEVLINESSNQWGDPV